MSRDSDAHSNNIRFQELLPFYVNGTLSGEELTWFQEHVASHPDSLAVIEAERLWAQHVKGAVDTIELPATEPELMEKVYAYWQAKRLKKNKAARLRNALTTPWRVPVAWLGAGGLALAGQLAIILVLLGGGATAPMRGVPHSCQPEPLLRLTLRPDASWQEVVLLLRSQGWTLRSGPNEGGQIWIAFPAGSSPEAVLLATTKLNLVESSELSTELKHSGCQK